MSVIDNVLIGAHTRLKAARPRGGPLAELALALLQPPAARAQYAAAREEAAAILVRFGERLMPRLDHPAHTLSYANRRRVEIARALALRPRLLLLDDARRQSYQWRQDFRHRRAGPALVRHPRAAGRIVADISIDFARPRDRTGAALQEMRRRITEMIAPSSAPAVANLHPYLKAATR